MKKNLFLIMFTLTVFLFTNVKCVNTIDSEALIYNQNNIYEESEFDISFFSFNILNIPEVFKDLDIKIISIKPNNDFYNISSIEIKGRKLENITSNLIEDYSNELINKGYDEEALYSQINGFNIRSMRIRCIIKELIELENRINII